MPVAQDNNLLGVAEDILDHVQRLVKHLTQNSITPPSLDVGSRTELWTSHEGEIGEHRQALVGLTQRLDMLVQGPHGFLHEYVSTNWELGALYTLLEFGILEKIPLAEESSVHVDLLVEGSTIPAEKLLRMCRLMACAGILKEAQDGFFGHTAISEELVRDPGFASWVGFQLYETRVSSAHLSDSLNHPNPFWKGQSAFEHAWGTTMYEWHAKHPDKGARFRRAMESVSKSLDPGDGMITDWFASNLAESLRVIHIQGKTGSFAVDIALRFPGTQHEVQDSSGVLVTCGENDVRGDLAGRISFRERDMFAKRSISEITNPSGEVVYLLRSVLWCLGDDECIDMLRSFIPVLEAEPQTRTLLIGDLVSPVRGAFEPHVERAFRRRDVTLMTMHNAKQRTSAEWEGLIKEASGRFVVEYSEKATGHSCRGLWAVRMG